MKDLDKECIELNRELVELENAYIDSQRILKKRKNEEPDESTSAETEALAKSSTNYVERINSLRLLARQKLTEKTAIAVNMGNIIEKFSRKLDTDLAFFETDLKGCGEFETPKGAEPGSEVGLVCSSRIDSNAPSSTNSSILQCLLHGHRSHSASRQTCPCSPPASVAHSAAVTRTAATTASHACPWTPP
jgi:hypothetical protein